MVGRPQFNTSEMFLLAFLFLPILCVTRAAPLFKKVLVAGDSWGTRGSQEFVKVMGNHSPETRISNIAVAGSTAEQWSVGGPEGYLDNLQVALKDSDFLWLTVMGNDAPGMLLHCAKSGENPDKCVDDLMISLTAFMHKIVETAHVANPSVRIVGFGYDLLGLDACPKSALVEVPQCQRGNQTSSAPCLNRLLKRLQDIWSGLAKTYDYVDAIDLRGSLQAARGYKSAGVGSPDLTRFSPSDLYRDCIHPTDEGYQVLFENMWSLYWRGKLSPSSAPTPIANTTDQGIGAALNASTPLNASAPPSVPLPSDFLDPQGSSDSKESDWSTLVAGTGVAAVVVLVMFAGSKLFERPTVRLAGDESELLSMDAGYS